METKFYYDFNEKKVTTKVVIKNEYGNEYFDCSDIDLKKINIYPIENKDSIPDGWKKSPVAGAEELINEGPLYAHDDKNAWIIHKIYYREEEIEAYKKIQSIYINDIEPIWNLYKTEKINPSNFYQKIIKVLKICKFIFKK